MLLCATRTLSLSQIIQHANLGSLHNVTKVPQSVNPVEIGVGTHRNSLYKVSEDNVYIRIVTEQNDQVKEYRRRNCRILVWKRSR
jgi:hypothetical protein